MKALSKGNFNDASFSIVWYFVLKKFSLFFRHYIPLESSVVLHINKPKFCFDYKNYFMISNNQFDLFFHLNVITCLLFWYYPHFKKVWSFIWINLIFVFKRMLQNRFDNIGATEKVKVVNLVPRLRDRETDRSALVVWLK